jgi:TrmH family RNA methyltransferase
VVEGEKVVGELLAARFPFLTLYATHDWSSEFADARTVQHVTPEEMARVSHFPTPSRVLAIGRITRHPLPAGALDQGLTLALDGVQDAGNVGTLLRIADWFGFARVVPSPDCADLFHQKVINASMGSFARVTTHTADLPAALATVGPATPILGCDLAGDDVGTLDHDERCGGDRQRGPRTYSRRQRSADAPHHDPAFRRRGIAQRRGRSRDCLSPTAFRRRVTDALSVRPAQ